MDAYQVPFHVERGVNRLRFVNTGTDPVHRVRAILNGPGLVLSPQAAEKVIDEMLAATAGVADILAGLPFEPRRIAETQRRLAYRRKILAAP